MLNQNSSAIAQSKTTAAQRLLTFSILLSLAIFLPSIVHQQAITGSLINAILLLAVLILGESSALMIGVLPSAVALSRGLLPLPLAPMVPFIMISNSLYVMVFGKFFQKSFIGGLVLAAVLKFGLLFSVSQLILPALLPGKFLTVASAMMSWPQLVTALSGGIIAWLVGLSLGLDQD